jgi:hypothetical protein
MPNREELGGETTNHRKPAPPLPPFLRVSKVFVKTTKLLEG